MDFILYSSLGLVLLNSVHMEQRSNKFYILLEGNTLVVYFTEE